MQRRHLLWATLSAIAGTGAWASEVLDRPARISALADQRLITGIARAGDRLVAVGQRGHVVHSADRGRTWAQAQVPVSADLTAVGFVNANVGRRLRPDPAYTVWPVFFMALGREVMSVELVPEDQRRSAAPTRVGANPRRSASSACALAVAMCGQVAFTWVAPNWT